MATLYKGDQGPDVQTLQMSLNKYGYGLTLDGQYGDLTEQAVRDFQGKHGLTVDGIAGAQTLSVLVSPNALPLATRSAVASAGPMIPAVNIISPVKQNLLLNPGLFGYPMWMELTGVLVGAIAINAMLKG